MIWYTGGQINIDKGGKQIWIQKTVLKIQNIGLIEANNKGNSLSVPYVCNYINDIQREIFFTRTTMFLD